jgi:hypoxia up-regulated 1
LSEAWDKELGADDMKNTLIRILVDKFDSLPERAGKPSVMDNERALGRLKKDTIKIMEILSANKFASIKVPELLDYVTLQFSLQRETFEAANEEFFSRVMAPVHEALKKAGLNMLDIDQIELLGGGVRIPKVAEILQKEMGKELSVHLNGDEAMCFGAAFIASNSSAAFKVRQIYLTQNPESDIYIKLSPLKPEDAMTVEEQEAEGTEEADIIKYTQEFRLFNSTDYIGKTKALSVNYNKNMKIEIFRSDRSEELLKTDDL